jgi:lysophospholipase L1-like esterase
VAWVISLVALSFLVAATPGVAATKEVVVFLGDSLTQGGGDFGQDHSALAIYNFGVSGDTTMGIWNRLDEVVATWPTQIYLQAGINDLGQGVSGQTIVKYHQKIWAELRRRVPEAKLFVISLLPINEAFFSQRSSKWLKNANIQRVNRLLAESVKEAGLPYIDLYWPLLGPDGQLPNQFTFDGVHLTAPAYQIWRGILKAYLP